MAFGHDYQARLEYSEKALDSVATTAKRIVPILSTARPASYSFFAGCSNGGREGMVFAQRFPQQFDGIVAESPGFCGSEGSHRGGLGHPDIRRPRRRRRLQAEQWTA